MGKLIYALFVSISLSFRNKKPIYIAVSVSSSRFLTAKFDSLVYLHAIEYS
jgi:hypothetical protein